MTTHDPRKPTSPTGIVACLRPSPRDPEAIVTRLGKEAVRAAVLGQGQALSRSDAIDVWSRTVTGGETELGQLLVDEGEDVEVRLAAARALGKRPTDRSRALLRDVARVEDRVVASTAVKLLGEVGTREDLATLIARGAKESDDPAVDIVAERARFSAALIAHRLGLQDDAPPLVAGAVLAPPSAPRPIAFQRASASDYAKFAVSTKRMYGVATAPEHAYLLRCTRNTFGVLLEPNVVGDLRGRLARPAVLGLVVRWLPLTRTYGLYMVVLARPEANSVSLLVYQDNGRPRFAGHGTFAGDALRMSLSAVAAPGASAVALAGELTAKSLRCDTATFSAVIDVPKRVPALERPQRARAT